MSLDLITYANPLGSASFGCPSLVSIGLFLWLGGASLPVRCVCPCIVFGAVWRKDTDWNIVRKKDRRYFGSI